MLMLAQVRHWDKPLTLAYEPLAHIVQVEALKALLNFPISHGMQVLAYAKDTLKYVPVGHGRQLDLFVVLYHPNEHGCSNALFRLQTVPGSHVEHSEEPTFEIVPVGH